ncbi:hypothetical protein O4J55_12260 [Paracoccus sp. PXZ]
MRKWLNWIGLGLMAAAAASMIAADAFADPASDPAALSMPAPDGGQGDAAGPVGAAFDARRDATSIALRSGDQLRLPPGLVPQSVAERRA